MKVSPRSTAVGNQRSFICLTDRGQVNLRVALRNGRTADYSAAQQVIFSLLESAASAGRQKSVCFCLGIGVFFTPEDFTNPIGVSSEFVNDICVSHTLHAQDVNCYSLGKSERLALFCDSVQNHTCHWVSFVIGVIPKKIWHDGASMVARWVSGGVSGISPSTQISRASRERAVSSAGEVIRGHFPSALRYYSAIRTSQTRNTVPAEHLTSMVGVWARNGYGFGFLWFRNTAGGNQHAISCRAEWGQAFLHMVAPVFTSLLGTWRAVAMAAVRPFSVGCWHDLGAYSLASTHWSAVSFIMNAAGTEGRHPRFVADWGQARLHVAPVSSLLEPGRVGVACAARPFSQGGCHA